jgi:hypothetical protein
MFKKAAIVLISLICVGSLMAQSIWYVRAGAPVGQNGTSWTLAFSDLQTALRIAQSGDQVRIAQGRYMPTRTAEREATFWVTEGVRISGGFRGDEPPSTAIGSPELFPTILSGNIGAQNDSTDNSFHVVTLDASKGISIVLEGVTIEHGLANGNTNNTNQGGGLWVTGSTVTGRVSLRQCIFGRSAALQGAHIGSMQGRLGSLVVESCQFNGSRNMTTAVNLSLDMVDSLVFSNCTFQQLNTREAALRYRSIATSEAVIALRQCSFTNNQGILESNLVDIRYGKLLVLDRCTLSGNTRLSSILQAEDFSNIRIERLQAALNEVQNLIILRTNNQRITAAQSKQLSMAYCSIESNRCIADLCRFDTDLLHFSQNSVAENQVGASVFAEINNLPGPAVQVLENNVFRGNVFQNLVKTAPSQFGLSDNSHLRCIQNLFTGNEGAFHRGPTTKINKTTLTARWYFCTFAQNIKPRASGADSLEYWFDGRNIDSTLFNSCIFADALQDGWLYDNPTGWLGLSHNLLVGFGRDSLVRSGQRVQVGNDNIFRIKPVFTNPDRFDFRLHPCSAVGIDQGDGAAVASLQLRADLWGLPRMANAAPDIGAWETARFIRRDSVRNIGCSSNDIGTVFYGGGTCPPLQYRWSSGRQAGDNATGLIPGTYIFTVTDAYGSRLVDTVTLTSDLRLSVTADVRQPVAPLFNDGRITLQSVLGGKPPYTVRWNTGSVRPDLSGLSPGIYTVTITDATPCYFIQQYQLGLSNAYNIAKEKIKWGVYPNPLHHNGMLTFDGVPKGYALRVTDFSGKCLYQQESNGQTWSVPFDWPAGVYRVMLYRNNMTVDTKTMIHLR